MRQASRPRVLATDHEPQVRRAPRIYLTRNAYEVILAATGREALVLAADEPPDLIVLELIPPDLDGTQEDAAPPERGGD